jgi:hypothetical protein
MPINADLPVFEAAAMTFNDAKVEFYNSLAPIVTIEHDIQGGLNWSVQHYLEVYLPEFESPKFVAGVD